MSVVFSALVNGRGTILGDFHPTTLGANSEDVPEKHNPAMRAILRKKVEGCAMCTNCHQNQPECRSLFVK